MKTKELEKLFKDKLAKDGINKKWMDKKLYPLCRLNQ